jgi:chaperonin cofactor prefoldin
MANETLTSIPTVRGTGKENLSAPLVIVEEKRFESEIKRIDTAVADGKKVHEKFETEVLRRFDKVDARFDKVDVRFDKVDARFDKIDARFEKVDVRFEKLEESIDARFEKAEKNTDAKLDKLNDKIDSHFKWMITLLVGTILVPIALQYFAK